MNTHLNVINFGGEDEEEVIDSRRRVIIDSVEKMKSKRM